MLKVQSENSSNAKKQILNDNRNVYALQETLRFLFDKNIVTGISKKKIIKNVTNDANTSFTTIIDVFNYLIENNTGRDIDIANVRTYCVQQSEYTHILFEIFSKSIKLGITEKSVNEVFENLIPTWEVQQGYPLSKYPLKGDEYIFITEKLNGVRCTFYNGILLSRQNKEFSGLEHIITELIELNLTDCFIDGELIRINNNPKVSDNENFRLTTSILSDSKLSKDNIKFVIFDAFPISTRLPNGTSRWIYSQRREFFKDFKSTHIETAPLLYEGNIHSHIEFFMYCMDRDGKEGCMINLDVPYQCKRHRGLLKVKTFYSVDLRIIGYEEGDGRNKGRLGAFVVDFKGNKVNVGSGFSNEQRSLFWQTRNELIGKICEVKYKDISEDKNTKIKSLQFPTFVCIRDKITESYD